MENDGSANPAPILTRLVADEEIYDNMLLPDAQATTDSVSYTDIDGVADAEIVAGGPLDGDLERTSDGSTNADTEALIDGRADADAEAQTHALTLPMLSLRLAQNHERIVLNWLTPIRKHL